MLVTKAVVYRETEPSPEERDKKPQVGGEVTGCELHLLHWGQVSLLASAQREAALGQQFQRGDGSGHGHLVVVREPVPCHHQAALQMPPCCPVQQRVQNLLPVKKKGSACSLGAGRERGDTGFMAVLRNLATAQKYRTSVCKKTRQYQTSVCTT